MLSLSRARPSDSFRVRYDSVLQTDIARKHNYCLKQATAQAWGRESSLMKYILQLVCIVGDSDLHIFGKTYGHNVTECVYSSTGMPVFDLLGRLFPALNSMGYWVLDDGTDAAGTEYCQYAHYDDENESNYLLATWCAVFDDGTMPRFNLEK